MTEQRSISFMIACIRDVLTAARNDETRSGLEQAIKVLEWMSKGELVLKELMRLRKEEQELFQAFSNLIRSGAKLSAVRDIEPERMGL